ncbi:hypothetical protein HanRHA438_Chr17g0797201 [Helianthus annuus]|uniref:Uncharacterized protein n=1 Tax=Helianthus annuus TaxID=4232 RepID=A0A251THU9_HELAN|nr:hypothetical protein HanHA300_Chr17g0641181 [Helianthus annuus]KAJ0446296.1 hypothetical protein HanHA89_Chr17g0692771 [Helianthus annuus]KAJ0631251.1 hypothetical protein HanLR1_Chr17g0651981 [Helianthus annuus]KAJ0635133.1 hypothetical protein HanOQP8_Chr17g0647541 [Helianthus annuus]KAJ0824882.1 hypothetical protein HanRHA438_Chr17g0797201 [Helianthus annuus]
MFIASNHQLSRFTDIQTNKASSVLVIIKVLIPCHYNLRFNMRFNKTTMGQFPSNRKNGDAVDWV